MKKNAKIRLTLNRETLRNLNAEELTTAPGGSGGICPITDSCFQTYCVCVSASCPTRCGQPYC